jgi:DNA topoisomerase-1
MDKDTVPLADALRLLSLPRSLGADPDTGEEVFADFGRFGPYLKRGKDTRSIPKDEDLFGITLDRAREIFKEEKRGRGWRRTPAVLRELGERPDSKAAVKLLDGRYGPYVTDGATNASIPRGANPAEVTLEQAVELLKAREAAGPAKPRRGKAGGWKKKAKAPVEAAGETPAKAGGAESRSPARKKKSAAKASTRAR